MSHPSCLELTCKELQQPSWNHEVTEKKAKKIDMLSLAECNEMKAYVIDDIDLGTLELLTQILR